MYEFYVHRDLESETFQSTAADMTGLRGRIELILGAYRFAVPGK